MANTPIAIITPEPVRSQETLLYDYQPSFLADQVKSGVCIGQSEVISVNNVWRCRVDSEVFDPCFVSSDNGKVICGVNPAIGFNGFLLNLDSPLPSLPASSTQSQIWLITLEDGTLCQAEQSGKKTLDGHDITFTCSNSASSFNNVILGMPASGTTWVAEKALVTDETPAKVISHETETIKQVWRFNNETSPKEAMPVTRVIEYSPADASDTAVEGVCWSNSLIVPSRTAWQCSTGKENYDPCFPVGEGKNMVCQPNPLSGKKGIYLKLREPLPASDLLSGLGNRPWLLEVDNSNICQLSSGATGLIAGKRITYICTDNSYIIGEPLPGETWMAQQVKSEQVNNGVAFWVPILTVVKSPSLFKAPDCSLLIDTISSLLGMKLSITQASFHDPITDESGIGCKTEISDLPWKYQSQPFYLLRDALIKKGWQEDHRYLNDENTSLVSTGLRNGNTLCLLSVAHRSGDYSVSFSCASDITSASIIDTPLSFPEEVSFQAGTTATSLEKNISSGEFQDFAIRAFAGQTMLVDITSQNDDVFFNLQDQDSNTLIPAGEDTQHWAGKLPSDRIYIIRIVARGLDSRYKLNVIIPVDINIEDNKPAVFSSRLHPGETMHYIVNGMTGNSLKIDLQATPGTVLAIEGIDGQVILAEESGQTSWEGALPSSQPYLIKVISQGPAGEYTLKIENGTQIK